MTVSRQLAFALTGLALSACNPPAANDGNAAAVAEGATAGAGAVQPAATVSLWNNGQAKPLEIQVAHPNGVVLQVTSLQSRATDTAVGVRVINGRKDEIDLNRWTNNREGFLLLESGERLYLSPPTTNPRLTVPAGQTFEGELVFLGRLPAVKSGVLVLNEDSSTDSQYSTNPGFRIDLPLGQAAAGAAQ
ncbi:hypothetical protein M0208_04625 [Sphingomonas sp. SUN019]|uniref:hypothetical protein n=1 Tax=Sphingomonas sp. SUN019 TaxID=2937788 RepID=UPI002164A041|nr:hypothetical protein [Sphingomonas sp. SUN019]UVO49838.1 hypothetical protein M0208_04625 [Sphingomonas sp. SUN019]